VSSLIACGASRLAVDPQILALGRPRCHLDAFVASDGEPNFAVERSRTTLLRPRAFEGSPAKWGFYEVHSAGLRVQIPDDVYAAESALRVAWQLVTWRQGGFLAHGCGLKFKTGVVAAIGVSGAGKSTLARLSSGPPAGATLLTDEIVQLFPEGRCHGTPFRSDASNVGSPDGGPLKAVLLLEKGSTEQLRPVSAPEAIPELLSNLYRGAAEEVVQAELLKRLLALISAVGVFRLTFRKDPAVGPFLTEWLARRDP
jgi:hypothetical protein